MFYENAFVGSSIVKFNLKMKILICIFLVIWLTKPENILCDTLFDGRILGTLRFFKFGYDFVACKQKNVIWNVTEN